MRIVVTNAVLSNTGDAAIFQGIRKCLLAEGLVVDLVDVQVCDSHAADSRLAYPDWPVLQQVSYPDGSSPRVARVLAKYARRALLGGMIRSPRLRRAVVKASQSKMLGEFGRTLSALDAADVIISSGGTYLVDHYDFRGRVLELRLAKALGKPVVLWTQSLGPFRSRRARRAFLRLVPAVDAVFFRDEKSRRAWEALAPIPALSGVAPDVAFALDCAGAHVTSGLEGTEILVSVREWPRTTAGGPLGFSGYAEALRETVRADIGHGVVRWRAISTCQGMPGYGVDDSAVATSIFLGEDVAVDTRHHRPDALMRELSTASVVVATRMHLALLALVCGKPVIAIAYEFKTLELFRHLGLEEFVVEIENLTAEWLVDKLSKVLRPDFGEPLSADLLADLADQAAEPARAIRSGLL